MKWERNKSDVGIKQKRYFALPSAFLLLPLYLISQSIKLP